MSRARDPQQFFVDADVCNILSINFLFQIYFIVGRYLFYIFLLHLSPLKTKFKTSPQRERARQLSVGNTSVVCKY
jgi:hypothetical protein